MLNIRHDFGFFGRLFGVPRKFLSQVGAFCASLTSGHPIIDVRVPAFPDPGGNAVTIGVDEDALSQFVKAQTVNAGTGNRLVCTNADGDIETVATGTVGAPASGVSWSDMLKTEPSGSYDTKLVFYPPTFNDLGQITGFASTGIEIGTFAAASGI